MKRILTQDEETVIRLVHHDFAGVSVEVAATQMGWTVRKTKGLLRSAERKAPTMFPIVTPRQRAIIEMYDQHMSREAIMAGLEIGITTLKKEVTFLREHKLLWNRKPDQYRSWMDGDVKEKF